MFNLGFGLTIELVDARHRVPGLPWVSINTLLGISSSAAFAVTHTHDDDDNDDDDDDDDD